MFTALIHGAARLPDDNEIVRALYDSAFITLETGPGGLRQVAGILNESGAAYRRVTCGDASEMQHVTNCLESYGFNKGPANGAFADRGYTVTFDRRKDAAR